jgi:hypothetical protein
MGIKSLISKPYAALVHARVKKEASRAVELQEQTFQKLITSASQTAFGIQHGFADIRNQAQFADSVPIQTYESLEPWIEKIKAGNSDILWPGKPIYFCKTSGTTSGTKYIPLTKESLPNHIGTARNALLCYIHESGNSAFADGQMIFLQGSPELKRLDSGIPVGRLSGIVANHVPAYLQKNRLPSYRTNCIEDWETKVRSIVKETVARDMRLISGIPSWVQMYFELLLEESGSPNISSLFPNFSLFVFGGVNFEPYRVKFHQLIGEQIDTLETYPASEGFIAFQDSRDTDALLLNVHSGIYFEFIPVDDFHNNNPKRLSLAEVKTDVQYVLLLSNNAGLWAYCLGDTVKFESLHPPRIKVTGRIKHFTSAFGEHVIGEEVDKAISAAAIAFGAEITEFHVAPNVHPQQGLPYHEWFIECTRLPTDQKEFAHCIDQQMQKQNIYYRDLVVGHVLRPLIIRFVKEGSFAAYMKTQGKLGGQNKVPRLSNDRKIADQLQAWTEFSAE